MASADECNVEALSLLKPEDIDSVFQEQISLLLNSACPLVVKCPGCGAGYPWNPNPQAESTECAGCKRELKLSFGEVADNPFADRREGKGPPELKKPDR